METIVINYIPTSKSKKLLDFLKKEKIKAEVLQKPTKSQILKSIETGAEQASQYLKGKIKLKDTKLLLGEL
jgi:hypothetical protein